MASKDKLFYLFSGEKLYNIMKSIKMKSKMTPIELLNEISSWLSFNQNPSGEELAKMKIDIDKVVSAKRQEDEVYLVIYTDRYGEDAIENIFSDMGHAKEYLSHNSDMNDALIIITHPIQHPTAYIKEIIESRH